MLWRMWSGTEKHRNSRAQSAQRKPKSTARRTYPLRVEPLEDRVLLTVTWGNRLTPTDTFTVAERAVIDQAISLWNQILPGGIAFNLTVEGGSTSSVELGGNTLARTSSYTEDGSGNPASALIRVDHDAGNAGTWFIDPTPNDNSEFTNLATRFCATSITATGSDLLSVMCHELGHALGFTSSYTDYAANVQNSAGPNTFYQGATFTVDLVDGDMAHLDPTANADDLMVPTTPGDTRRLPTDLDAQILADAFGYTVVTPSTVASFLTNFNVTTGELVINGDPDLGDDTITIVRNADNLDVTVDGITEQFAWASVTSIRVASGGGHDVLRIDLSGGDPIPDGGLEYSHTIGEAEVIVSGADSDFTLSDDELDVSAAGLIDFASAISVATLTGGAGDNVFTVREWTGTVTAAGDKGDDRYVFNAGAATAICTIVELADEGNDTVDFSALSESAQALDWLRPAGTVTATSLVSLLGGGSVDVDVAGQQLNIEYAENVRAYVDPIDGDTLGVPQEPIPYSMRFVDVGTLTTHTAVINWRDGQRDDPATVVESPEPSVDGVVQGTHEFMRLGRYPVQVEVTNDGGVTASADTTVTIRRVVVKPDRNRPGEMSLYVGGTDGADAFLFVQKSDGKVAVTMPLPKYCGVFQPTANGAIYAFMGDGNDLVLFSSDVTRDGIIDAGAGIDVVQTARGNDFVNAGAGNDMVLTNGGNDTIFGGDGNDKLIGGADNDILLGGLGNDILEGGQGRNVLIGGLGKDCLYGTTGQSILVAGATDFDANEAALAAILDEWASAAAYNTRVGHLKGTIPGGLNGGVLLNSTTVHDDGAWDYLLGSAATTSKWYFARQTGSALARDYVLRSISEQVVLI